MPPKKTSAAGVFAGEVFCVSGACSLGTQQEVKDIIIANGGSVAATPNKTCTFVVADQLGSSKVSKAQKDGIDIVTAEWLSVSIKAGKKSTDKKLYLSGPAAAAADDDDDEEDSKPAKKAPAKKATAAKRKKPVSDEEDEEEEDADDDADDAPKKSQKKSASSGPSGSGSAEPAARIKTVVVKGSAPVDEICPVHASVHVYTSGAGDVYDAMLNQTNIG